MLLLSIWTVTTSIADVFQRGGTRVHLTAAASGLQVAGQIRGGYSAAATAARAPAVARTTPRTHNSPARSLSMPVDRTAVPAQAEPLVAESVAAPSSLENLDVDASLSVTQRPAASSLSMAIPPTDPGTATNEAGLAPEPSLPTSSRMSWMAFSGR